MNEIQDILRCVRENLNLDVAFVGQFVEDRRLFRYVDAIDPRIQVRQGTGGSLEDSYCQRVIDGRLPPVIADTALCPEACALADTRAIPIGAHVSVPIYLTDGSLFGTFCCFSHRPVPTLSERDLATLRTFAGITARRIERDMASDRMRAAKEERIMSLIQSGGPSILYQPVFMLDDLRIVGSEALSRFPGGAERPVDLWFKEAAEVGLQIDFELLAIENALRGYREVWNTRRIQLGLNASAVTIADGRLWDVLEGYPRDLVVVELTEHDEVQDYAELLEATQRLREGGTKIAIDDVGAGYASMRHVLMIRPDILKLDVGLVRSINDDDLKLALTSSLQHFAEQFDCRVVAEGVETEEELLTLRHLHIQAAQGYHLGRPGTSEALLNRIAGSPAPAATGSRDDRARGGAGTRKTKRRPIAV